jgi:hypothetical protein
MDYAGLCDNFLYNLCVLVDLDCRGKVAGIKLSVTSSIKVFFGCPNEVGSYPSLVIIYIYLA